MDLSIETLGDWIAAARTRRAILRKISSWVSARRAEGERHEKIIEQINRAGWAARFGKPLTVQLYHQERSVIARQKRGGTLLPPKRTTADEIADTVVDRLRNLLVARDLSVAAPTIVVPGADAARPCGFQKAAGSDELIFEYELPTPKPSAATASPEHFDFHADAARTRQSTKKEF